MRILIVDNDQNTILSIMNYMDSQGYSTDMAISRIAVFELLEKNSYDILYMDTVIAGKSCFDVCRLLRNRVICHLPILFLTSRGALKDKLEGFNAGADDYLLKPFSMEELLARSKALISRGRRWNIGHRQLLDMNIDYENCQVWRQNKRIKLNRKQYKIFSLLARDYPDVVSTVDIEYEVWGDIPPDSDVLKTQIYQLRSHIDKPFSTSVIKNIRGFGFKLELHS